MPNKPISDRNVYILGAGFSRNAGAPLVHDFLDRAREFLDNPNSDLDETERSQFLEVFAFKREMATSREKFRIDLDNIEQLFGLVEMSHRMGSIPPTTREAMVYLIAKTLQLAITNSKRPNVRMNLMTGDTAQAESFINFVERSAPGSAVFSTEMYRHFALFLAGKYDDQRRIPFRSSTVITFNYDLVLDDALTRIKIRPGYELDNATYNPPNDNPRVVPLLKLHGSTNWAICGDVKCNHVHILDQKATSNAEMFRSMRCAVCQEVGLRLLLVPPSWDKSEYSRIMQPVWKKAISAIQSATRICVIGYSMPDADAFFKFLLALGLAKNDALYKLVVVDLLQAGLQSDSAADAEQVPSIEIRWRRMLEKVFTERRFTFFGGGVENFLSGPICYELQRGEQIA